MLLTPKNSTNPILWGWEINFKDGIPVFKLPRIDVKEFDFIASFFPKDPEGARRYFKC